MKEEMAENTNLDLDSATLNSYGEVRELEEMDSQKILVISDYKSEKSDNFVVDIESFSNGSDRDRNANSFMLQRSISRKGCQRGGEKKTNSTTTASERDAIVATSSPGAALVGASTPEMATAVVVGATDNPSSSPQVHHHIAIKAGTAADSKWGRRNSFRRSPPSWTMDPKKVLLFFATLSSLGTILLILLNICFWIA